MFVKPLAFALILLFASLFNCAYSQSKVNREWKEGPLTWEDFQEINSANLLKSELRYQMGYHVEKTKMNDTMLIGPVATAYMDRRYSWVDISRASPLILRYNQVIFDMIEYKRRMMQKELYKITGEEEGRELLSQTIADCSYLVESFVVESRQGEDLQVVLAYELLYARLLKENLANNIPQLEFKRFSWGVYCSLGHTFLTGGLSNYLTSPTCYAFGSDFAWKKHYFSINGNLGGMNIKSDFRHDTVSFHAERFSYTILELCYGYCLRDGAKAKVIPFAGLSVTDASEKNVEDPKTWSSYYPSAGIIFDYKFRKRLLLHPQVRSKELATYALRTRCSSSYVNFGENMKGLAINVSLGLLISYNFIVSTNRVKD